MAVGVAGGVDEGEVFGWGEPGSVTEWADRFVEVKEGGAEPAWMEFWERPEGALPFFYCDEYRC